MLLQTEVLIQSLNFICIMSTQEGSLGDQPFLPAVIAFLKSTGADDTNILMMSPLLFNQLSHLDAQ